MAIQTSATQDPAVAIQGLASRYADNDEMSYAVETAACFNGQFVVMGSVEARCKAPASSADVTTKGLGVVRYMASKMPPVGGGYPYVVGDTAPVIRKGRIWVLVEEAVVLFDPAFVRFAANGGNTILGNFRKSADTASAVALPGSYFLTAAGIGGLALLDLNLPQ